MVEYYDLTLGDVIGAYHMFRKQEIEEWKRTRMLMFTIHRMLGDPKRVAGSPEEIMELPGDEKKYGGMTKEEIAAELQALRDKGFNV